MDCSAPDKPELAAVKLAEVHPLCGKPAAIVLIPVTSMFSKLALDKVGAHHVLAHLVSFEKYQLPQGSGSFILQMMVQTLWCLESSLVVSRALSLTLMLF